MVWRFGNWNTILNPHNSQTRNSDLSPFSKLWEPAIGPTTKPHSIPTFAMVEETHSEPPSATPSHSSHASPNDTAFFPLKRRSKHLSTPTADLLCSQCRLTFANEDDIAHHMRLRHRFPCRLCLFGFESLRLLSKHRRAVHGWQCPVCLIDCYTKEEYDQHQETHHLHPCRYCWFHMDSAELREIHEEKFHYSPKCYRWDQCKRDCANRDHLDEHIRSNHHYRCRYCKDGFPIERLRHTHQAVCNGPTSCKERDYRAERDQHVEEYRDDLIKLEVRDVFSHSDQRCAKHQDDLIEFQVPDRMSHTDQLSVEHNGTAALHRLRCQQCNISFDTDERLATHFQNTHRHQCSLCEEAFPTKIILSQHITQFHYYPCPKCTWNSQTELELNQHLSEHHSSKCPFASCRLPFETEEDVRLHLAVDHARCGVCKVQFPTAEALQKHRVLAHSRGEGGAWGSASASQNSGGRPQLQHERRGSTSDEDINASSAMDADKGDESDDTDHTRLYEVDSEEDEEDEGVFLPEVERGEWGVGFARLLAAAESEDPDTSS
ncbi:hypothetical protein DFJ77DRAFT_62564 [Powellomyces hirtus]|nr:hypothetical protein DFJ77DRAFT_62564 [Powellomyces hirtus]